MNSPSPLALADVLEQLSSICFDAACEAGKADRPTEGLVINRLAKAFNDEARALRSSDGAGGRPVWAGEGPAPTVAGLSQDDIDKLLGSAAPKCGCWQCVADRRDDGPRRMILCPECGNKRCPKASNHRHACTHSNEPGQHGSVYGDYEVVAAPASPPAETREGTAQVDRRPDPPSQTSPLHEYRDAHQRRNAHL